MTLRPHISNSATASRVPATGSALRTPKSEFRIPNFQHSALRTPHLFAFTLIELLVVIGIIGALMAIGLPAMRGMTRSNAIVAANRQFIDDLSYARQSAIANHTTVYVVFVPTNIAAFAPPKTPKGLYKQYTNLYTGQYTTYALLSTRQLGEQPGRTTAKYLTDWRSLPNGVFISPVKFAAAAPTTTGNGTGFYYTGPSSPQLPFPVATNYPAAGLQLPFLAFNYLGQLINPAPTFDSLLPYGTPAQDQYIPFARGSIFFDPVTFNADVQENPPGNSINSSNVVYINALTGRAKILQQQVQ